MIHHPSALGEFMRRIISVVVIVWVAIVIGSPSALAAGSPGDIIRDTSDRMLDALRKNEAELKTDTSELYALVNKIVLPNFDFEAMSRWVLGRYWRQATPEQRKRFVAEFRTLLVRTYGSSLLNYTDASIRVLPMPPVSGDDVTVRSQVERGDGPPIPINYSMHRKNDVWKVYDVSVDGVSLVTTYRGSFADEIRQDGIDGLIAKLAKRNAQGVTSS
jgi:phospholipid transport system substrate-binding protein